ncbi:SAPS-domain-containing protein [Cylindrobasidium torrendii FP15055 ss-10]|uniref:SAPS-domain-containing protein n=1 Tax=Cylindrobasidium torrendii FP15055 ss-10 TaxID=1314674 RepID=A0A0D7BIN8_9AGAR|nr:SAPS-domain-containing protein [Cylindrobasidium torrendii FP15055 ss-10]
MFWSRFGFSAASGIDTLLDKDDVSLEAILDEDELLQECKAQNTRLMEYFQRPDVLQRLLGYVTGEMDGEERGKFKYPYVATEVLCSDIWSIVETCVNEQTQLLAPFWHSVLDRPPEEMKTQMVMATHFGKINAVFMSKKPAEMLAFIQSLPTPVESLLKHIDNPPFVELLVRIIQLDEYPGGSGVLEWLSSQHLMAQLIRRLSPEHPPELHVVIADLIKGIISIATPAPGSSVSEGQNVTSSNLFARELARRESISQLVNYTLRDFGPNHNVAIEDDHTSAHLPSFDSSTSSVVQSAGVIIELIRKNNSDYFEPYLFHTLRNRLMQVQQQGAGQPESVVRESLEKTMKNMVDRMGVVHLGPVLDILNECLPTLLGYLKAPRSSVGPVNTTVGTLVPLTFERFRICELVAELIHCSNMSLLNRLDEENQIYDAEGRLKGGLAGLEGLAKVVDLPDPSGTHGSLDDIDEMEPSMELPISHSAHSPSSIGSDTDMSDDDAMEAMEVYEDMPISASPPTSESPPSGESTLGAPLMRMQSHSNSPAPSGRGRRSSQSSRRNSRRYTPSEPQVLGNPVFAGEKIKARLLELGVIPVLLDLFFEYPWNNFLHSTVYDIIHQVLTGNLETGYNRELAVSLFRDAKLMHRIVDGQNRNDEEAARPKGVRLGYMGHLHMISEDVLIALESFPPEVRLQIVQYAPDPGWDEYVTGRYLEQKKRDSERLGGGKPVLGSNLTAKSGTAGKWKVDEEDSNTLTLTADTGSSDAPDVEMKGVFKRGGSRREGSADFGVAPMDDEETAPHFARYLAHELNQDTFGDDDEDEDGGWLSGSSFTLGNPPVSARSHSSDRKPLSMNGFDDSFSPSSINDPFSSADDDDGFGPFSDSAAISSSSDSFLSALSDADDLADDSTFDFGDFQGADDPGSPPQDGQLTPTAGSWTFASGDDESDRSGSASPPTPKKKM